MYVDGMYEQKIQKLFLRNFFFGIERFESTTVSKEKQFGLLLKIV